MIIMHSRLTTMRGRTAEFKIRGVSPFESFGTMVFRCNDLCEMSKLARFPSINHWLRCQERVIPEGNPHIRN